MTVRALKGQLVNTVWCVELRAARGAVEFHEFETGEAAQEFAKSTPLVWRTFEIHRHLPEHERGQGWTT